MTADSRLERPASYRRPGPFARAWLALAVAAGACACQTTPVTGSKAFNLLSAEEEIGLGEEAFQQIKASERLITSGPQYQMVQQVMNRIAAVADKEYPWEVILIDAPDVANAFALPGGKMAVYSGILPLTQSEAGLAAVMGHEIGHVVASHGAQRLSRQLPIDFALSLATEAEYQSLAATAIDLVVNLPWGRGDELEADEIGLIYMARAGYDPRESIGFWQRMQGGGGGGPPEFLSTHPAHGTRIEELKALMPKALAIYRD